MPDIHNQIDPCYFAVVPGFVVEAIIENKRLILLQVDSVVTDAHFGAFSAD
jgi:hypothetical protein